MIDLLHQRQEHADLARRKTFAREPVEIVSRQIGNHTALVLAVGHDACGQQLEMFGVHCGMTILAKRMAISLN